MALLVRAPASRAGIPGSRPAPTSCGSVDPGGYIGAVTRTGVRFRGVSVTDVAMPVKAVCVKPHSPDLKKRRSSD